MSQVFISYSRRDGKDVSLLVQKLEEAGHKVWLDRSAIQGGAKWQEEIVRGIERADVFVIVLSQQSIESENVEKELGLAYVTNKTILSVMLHRVVAPPRLQYALAGLEMIDISTQGIESGSQRLLNAIRSPDVRAGRVYLDRLHRDKLPRYLYLLILMTIGALDHHEHIQLAVIIAALAGVAVWAVRRLLIYRRLKSSGIVLSTELKGFTQLRSQAVCRIASEWRDPETGRRYEFYSRRIPSDISEFVERKIPVIVDPRNFKRYRVDLSFLPKEPRGALVISDRSETTSTERQPPSEGGDSSGQIFVSHSEQDDEAAGLLVQRLETAGHRVWTAAAGADSGDLSYQEQVINDMDGARLFLLVLSPDSVRSERVRSELDLALAKGKRIITVVLRRTITPEEMNYALVGVQHVDLSTDFETGALRLLDTMAAETPKVTVAPETTAAACAALLRHWLRVVGRVAGIFFSQFLLVALLALQYAARALPRLRPSVLKRSARAALWLELKGEDQLKDRGTVLLTEYKHIQASDEDSSVRILSQWRDPVSHELYLFHSRWLPSGEPEYIKTKTIAVYVDPKNLRRYSMDLSFLPRDKRREASNAAPLSFQKDDVANNGVFISYSHEQAAKAGLLIQRLEGAGYEVVNRSAAEGNRPGDAEIKTSIGLAQTFLIVVPPPAANDLGSKTMELRHACAIHRHIMPVTFDNSEGPPSMQLSLAGVQRIDLSQDIEAGMRLLLSALARRKPKQVAVPDSTKEFPRAVSTGRARKILSGAILGGLSWGLGSTLSIVLLDRGPGMNVNALAAAFSGLVFGGALGAIFYKPKPKMFVLLFIALFFWLISFFALAMCAELFLYLRVAHSPGGPSSNGEALTALIATLLGTATLIASKRIEARAFNYRLKKNGELLLTEYKGLYYERSEEHNGNHFVQVVSQWRDPVTDEVHTFVSENFVRNPSKRIRSNTIAVFVDPSNLKDYHMDLSFSARTGFTDEYVEQTTTGLGSRLWRSIETVVLGVILFVVAFPVLRFNEAYAVRTARSLQQGAKVVVDARSDRVDPANEGKLLHVTAGATTDESIADPIFGVSAHAIKLRRKVEMYQWQETSFKAPENASSSATEATYSYSPIWSEQRISSGGFNQPQGHQNPPMPFSSAEYVASDVKLGAFRLNRHMVGQLSGVEPVDVSQAKLPDSVHARARRLESGFEIGDQASPQIGDMRITFQQLSSPDVSIVARQTRDTFEPYQTPSGGSVELVVMGTQSADTMFASAQSASSFGLRIWLLRCLGFVLMFAGLALVLSPISAFGEAVPVVGNLMRFGAGIVSGLLALCLSLVTVAMAWMRFRPLVGISLLASAGILASLGYWTTRFDKEKPRSGSVAA